jgi:hypothetical protein
MPDSEKLHPEFIERWNAISYLVHYNFEDFSSVDIITKAPLPDHVDFSPLISEAYMDLAVRRTMCITADTPVSQLVASDPKILRYKSDDPPVIPPATMTPEEAYNYCREIRRRFIEEVVRPSNKQFWENEANKNAERRLGRYVRK